MANHKSDFTMFLAVTSIIGFGIIALNAFTGINLNAWADALLFIIIGAGLMMVGNIRSILKYIKDGKIDSDEMAHIMTALIGLLSVIAGFISLPIRAMSVFAVPAFEGIKGTIAIFALVFTVIEGLFVRK